MPYTLRLTCHTGGMKVLIAVDKFKGSLSGVELSQELLAGITRQIGENSHLHTLICPIADGGDGTVDAAIAAGYTEVTCPATASLPGVGEGGTVLARYALDSSTGTAVIEIAEAAGLWRLDPDQLDTWRATSYGAGEIILHALDAGATRLVIGVGGSATTDGGAGMLRALGASFTDASGQELAPGGGALADLAAVDVSGLDSRLAATEIIVACDVTNPLTGGNGAAAVYGPQKGATEEQVQLLDANLQKLADMVEGALNVSRGTYAEAPGAGAAGGLGFACLAALGATMRPGVDIAFELTGFNEKLPGADLVITGEGKLDTQTLQGKGPVGVVAAAREAHIPVVAICGANELDESAWRGAGFAAAYSVLGTGVTLQESLANPRPYVRALGEQVAAEHIAPHLPA